MKHLFELYCKDYENIENYNKALADNFKGWCVHHRLETHNSDGERRLVDITRDELKALGMCYNRPASELIFLTKSEHMSLHRIGKDSPRKGKKLSEETKNKISETLKGQPAWNKGKKLSEARKGKPSNMKGKHLSEEAKNKISESKKGNTNVRETRWFNNGEINIRTKECPQGFIPGMLK